MAEKLYTAPEVAEIIGLPPKRTQEIMRNCMRCVILNANPNPKHLRLGVTMAEINRWIERNTIASKNEQFTAAVAEMKTEDKSKKAAFMRVQDVAEPWRVPRRKKGKGKEGSTCCIG